MARVERVLRCGGQEPPFFPRLRRACGQPRRGRGLEVGIIPVRGELAEWSKAPDSKSGIRQRIGGSNPSLSARIRTLMRIYRADVRFCAVGTIRGAPFRAGCRFAPPQRSQAHVLRHFRIVRGGIPWQIGPCPRPLTLHYSRTAAEKTRTAQLVSAMGPLPVGANRRLA